MCCRTGALIPRGDHFVGYWLSREAPGVRSTARPASGRFYCS